MILNIWQQNRRTKFTTIHVFALRARPINEPSMFRTIEPLFAVQNLKKDTAFGCFFFHARNVFLFFYFSEPRDWSVFC